MKLTPEEMSALTAGLKVLHDHFPTNDWHVVVGPPVYSPQDFVIKRKLTVNGENVFADDSETK